MIRAFAAALALAVGASGNGAPPTATPASEKPPAAVLGITWHASGFVRPKLTHLKALSLRPDCHCVFGGGPLSSAAGVRTEASEKSLQARPGGGATWKSHATAAELYWVS